MKGEICENCCDFVLDVSVARGENCQQELYDITLNSTVFNITGSILENFTKKCKIYILLVYFFFAVKFECSVDDILRYAATRRTE